MGTIVFGQKIGQIPLIFAAIRRPLLPKQSTVWGNNPSAHSKLTIRSSLVGQSAPKGGSTCKLQELLNFLYDDLPHLFDEQGIDPSMYDDRVLFCDPITRHDTIDGYLFNIRLLKLLFSPDFQLHRVWQTGPYEITTRWTMVMKFALLPWKPELVFTGVSIMGVNPRTWKFCSHVDRWDSIENNEYFSLEGLLDVVRQLRIYKTPNLETPDYQILKRTSNYEILVRAFLPKAPSFAKVRKYASFVVVQSKGDKLSGSSGFNDVAGYIFGKNSTMERIPMTTPVFTQASDYELSQVSIQIVLPRNKDLHNLPSPTSDAISLRKVDGGIAGVIKFSGRPTEDIIRIKEAQLRSALIQAGLHPAGGCMLARYNDPERTWSFIMRNEVLIWLNEFSLD
ncbi:Heme-binding-like protein [Apostasia shenzhenica]|uniref:Heme-binding-like protein n=1 Tax=Apostasia shenzhenica TaxID=1088818 RepID=A0A2I0B6N2_9ASPA|nr:Heme-binding-like protein [Apostasia shenzhenica]